MKSFRKTLPFGRAGADQVSQSNQPSPPSNGLIGTPVPAHFDLSRSRTPTGRRTAQLDSSDLDRALPSRAPGWMRRARRMANALEAAVASGSVSASAEAGIDRAWAAWELGGASDRQIAEVSHLVGRAHSAIRQAPRSKLRQQTTDCAAVLHAGLGPGLQRRVPLEAVVQVVRGLQAESDPWVAAVWGTAQLLGWLQLCQAHGAQAVRIALEGRGRKRS